MESQLGVIVLQARTMPTALGTRGPVHSQLIPEIDPYASRGFDKHYVS